MEGLTGARAAELLTQCGPNEIVEKRPGFFLKLLKALVSLVSLMLIAAAALSYFVGHIFDGSFILSLLALNIGISLWHEHKTDNALEELKKRLAVSVRVRRDGAWITVPSRELVPGDVVECSVGSLVPADMTIGKAVNLEINEAVLTGESLPKHKKQGDTAYSGAVVVTGTFEGTVTATGVKAYFGKIATSATGMKRRSLMEKDILGISRFLIITAIVSMAIITVVFVMRGEHGLDIAILDLSLLIAGIPVSLPTVMTLIVSLGAVEVAKKNALVRRLSSLEDFANVNLLLTDKTGTLTENNMSVDRVFTYSGLSEIDVKRYAAAGAQGDGQSFIDRAIARSYEGDIGTSVEFVPGDSVRKRSTALVAIDGRHMLISLGTPPVIEKLCGDDGGLHDAITKETEAAAANGSRAIALAIKEDPENIEDEVDMRFAGVLVLADPLRPDAHETLAYLRKEGVHPIMLTGDTHATAAHVANVLGLEGDVLVPSAVDMKHLPKGTLRTTAAFSEVLPVDKLAIVTRAEENYTVAVTGDGVNDLPAVRKADVGIAVANAVDALKGTADIVLLDSGIEVLETALTESRKIFFRLYNYSVYRISESFRLIIAALILSLLGDGFPLTPIQIILLAFLNDIPIITLAFDRVKRLDRPADLKPKERFALGTLYGAAGIMNSVFMYFVLTLVFHLPLPLVQTAFFLKFTVSGHMLIFVAHTKERWWKFLPARSVIIATATTQALATALAYFGILIAPISLPLIAFVWAWSLFWMQVSELMKFVDAFIFRKRMGKKKSI